METTKVKVDDIKFNKGSYPRFEADNATVNQYRDCLSQLPPILVSKDLTLVDGYHRLLAHKLEGKDVISVEFFLSNDPKEILLEAIRLNSLHGRQLSQREKKDNCLKLWDQGLTEIEELLKLLSVDLTTINRWTKDKRADAKKKEEQEILDLYLQCFTQEEIAKHLGVVQPTVHNAIIKNTQLREIDNPENLQFYNVWNVGKLSSDQMKFPGQTPIDIVENIVYYYTEPPTKDPLHISKVVDPMAGSGIVRDVCRKLLRRYQLFDVKPLREDIPITQNNILEGFPEKAKGTDLVYFDPPYYNLMEEYPANDFNKDYPSFLDAMTTSLKNITTILNQNGKVALILKPMNEKMLEGEWFDLTFDCVAIAKKEGYKLVKRISAPLSTQQFTATDVTRAKEHKVMLNTLRDIVIFGRA